MTQEVNDQPGNNQPYDYTQNFAYDGAGNPTTFKSESPTYNDDNQRTGSGSFTYDGNGNPTVYKSADLTYDLESRLHTVEVGSDVQTNAYRADGLRAWKGWNVVAPAQEGDPVAVATYYFYDGGLPVLECNASGTVTAINVFAPDGLVSRKQSGSWRHYQFDPQGSVTHRLTDSETVTNSSMYDAYGKHVTLITPVYDAFGYNGRWGYYTDGETGLVLCTYRFYDPGTGRWMTRDPIRYAGGINLYGYCGGAPIGRIDPSGEGFYTIAGGILGGIGAAILSGGNPAAIAAGVTLGTMIGSARDQSDETGTVDAGKTITDGVIGGASGLVGGYLVSGIAKMCLPMIVKNGMVEGIHYTTAEAAESIAANGFRGYPVWGWPRPVPPIINQTVGSGFGKTGGEVIFEAQVGNVSQGWWGQIIVKGGRAGQRLRYANHQNWRRVSR